jgi:hypothetical protein
MWVKRLLKPGTASWKAYPELVLNTLIGTNSFKTSLNIHKNYNNLDPYYWTIIKSWNILKKKDITMLDVGEIRRQWLWLNKDIKVNKNEINWKKWQKQGIQQIHDIIDRSGNFLNINDLKTMYNLNASFLDYNSLKDAIPKHWREKLKTMKIERDTINSKENPYLIIKKKYIPLQVLTNKMIYWELIEKIRITAVTKYKWTHELGLKEETWENIFLVSKVIRDTKIRTFQYKLLFNLIPCNLYLFRIGRNNSDKCHLCNGIDNITHYFYDCVDTKQFWSSLQNWWNIMDVETIDITKDLAMIGIPCEGKEMLNACLQLARWYIYTERIKQKSTFLYRFLCYLKYKIKIEKMICQKNNQMKFFEKTWQKMEEHLN